MKLIIQIPCFNEEATLPETLHQHSLSGRDFHFTYGPLSQVLAYAGASLHSPWSAIEPCGPTMPSAPWAPG